MTKTLKRTVTLVLAIIMVASIFPTTAFATIADWENNNVVFDGTSFGTNGYYNVISKKDYVLVPGAAVESEIVLNNATGNRRQVLHIIEVDPSNPDVSIVPGYYQIDQLAQDPNNEANWSHQELTEMAKYYENNLGYNIVGGMNTDLYYNSYSPRVLVYNGEWIGNAHENVATGGTVLNPTSSILYVFKDAEGNVYCDVKAYNKAEVEGYLADGTLLHAVGVSFAMVVKDGKLVNTTEKRGNDDAARSMVGVKEDGTLVICMNDGRGANNSVGLSSYEEGEVMLALGCKWAANCDGGGSSTFISKRVGEENFEMRSVPCDGAQRPTAHGIFVASNVAPTGILDVVNVESDYDIFAPKTAYTFGASAIDTHGYAMDMPADATWALSDDSFGTITNGTFVSGGKQGMVDIQILSGGNVVGTKTITVADPEVFKLSATSTVIPYSTPDKIRTIKLPIVAMTGEANVYVDTNAVSVVLSNNDAGILDGFNFTATDDTSIAGVNVTITYGETVLTYAIEFGKGSEVIWDFEDGDKAGFMGFEEARDWSKENGINNSLVGSDPLAGQFSDNVKGNTFISSTTNGGEVRNGNYALAWRLDNTDADFAGWTYNVLFNTDEVIVFRDVANGKKATTLGMWIYIPENAFPAAGKGLAFQSQFNAYANWAVDGKASCVQDHFMFTSAATGKQTNLNSATNADIPESRWVYATIDISKYDYLSTIPATNATNTRSPSFIRTYVKPDTADVVTFYIDDITLDYSSAVDDRVLPTITAPTYSTSDTAISLENGTAITGNNVAFSATVADNVALDLTSGKIFVDGIEIQTTVASNVLSSNSDVVLGAGEHAVKFEISDELGNPAALYRTFTVVGDATVELSGHNDSGETPKAQSIYYVDINVADLTNVETLVAQLKLNNSNKWETKGAVVANGYNATFEYNEISEILTVTVELEDASKAKALDQTLVSIPVRIWTFDRFHYVTGDYATVDSMGNKPVVNIDVEVVCGVVDGTPFGGSINVATELTTISSPYHVHDNELKVLNKDADVGVPGYENRTYCETCKSVVDWGTIIPAIVITHNYEIVDGKFVCQDEGCGIVYESGTGVFEMNGALYYSIAGKLVTGWQDAGDGKRCFAYSSYKLAVGSAAVNGITYEFDEMGGTYGAWVKDEKGTKFSYGPAFYSCATAASPHANVAWATIYGDTYAFDKQGYRHEGVSVLVESNNPAELYEFTDEGVLIGKFVTDHNGIYVCNNGTAYLENGKPVAAGLVYEDGNFYYINSGYRAVTGSYEITRTNGLLDVGTYEFGADGKMINPPRFNHGIVDGVYYINGVVQKTWELFEWEGNYYFNKYYNIAANERVYLGAQFVDGFTYPNGDQMLPGYYNFDEEGRMIIINGVVDGLYYKNGIAQKTWEVFVWEGNYYFNKYYNVAANETVYLGAQFVENFTYPDGAPMVVGYYNFDADGKMIILNGVVDGVYYINGIAQKTWELFKLEDDYYFNKYYNIAADETVYLGSQFVDGKTFSDGRAILPGYYDFDADGKLIVPELKHGIIDDKIYINDVLQKAYQLVEFEGNYYFINNAKNEIAKSITLYLSARFVDGKSFSDGRAIQPGNYYFDADGKMAIPEIKHGIIDDKIYINDVLQKAYQLVEFEGNYYFVNNARNEIAKNITLYLGNQFVEGKMFSDGTPIVAGIYEFDAEGKMVILNGPQDDGYFYINGLKQLAYQLIEFEGNYYFINDGNKYAVNKTLYLRENFLEGTPFKEWYYQFDSQGRMIGATDVANGVPNGRDIGAIDYIKTTDGKDIKEGLYIRGGELDGAESGVASLGGAEYLMEKYSIKTEIDLRGQLLNAQDVFGEDVEHKYFNMVFYSACFTDKGKAVVKDIFTELANPDNYPIYIHCSRGIDRVGAVTYILEAVLGVPESKLANEYMLSLEAYGNDILKIRDGLKAYGGATIKECAEAYLLDCGLTQSQIDSLRNIFIEG